MKRDRKIVINLIIKLLIFNLIIYSIIILSCGKKEDNPPLAKFNGGEVTMQEYVQHFLLSTQYKPELVPTEKNLREIVVDKSMEKIAIFEARLHELDQDSTLKEQLRQREDIILFQRYMREQMINKVITDSLVELFYKGFTPQYRMRYILRAATERTSQRVVKAQKDTIQWLYQQLEDGEKFEELAEKYSQDLRSGPKGGDLGFVVKESLGDAKLREVMQVLPDLSFSKPFRGVAGFYILYKGERRDVPIPTLEEVRGRIWQTLYRTRRHDVEQLVNERFQELSPHYHYQIDSTNIEKIRKKAAEGNTQKRGYTWLNYDQLEEDDFKLVVATFKGGVITAGDIFADRKKRPSDMWEFDKRLGFLSQQRLFALDAREKGYDKLPEIQEEMDVIFDALLRNEIYQRKVRNIVNAKLDSLREKEKDILSGSDLKQFLNEKRAQLEEQIRGKFEEQMKKKYQFRFITENFSQALKKATTEKQAQSKEKQES